MVSCRIADRAGDGQPEHAFDRLPEAFSPDEGRRLATRLEVHYTPKHGSWLNMAEIEPSILTRQCLNGRIANPTTLAAHTETWEGERNATEATVHWQFTTKKARTKLKQLYPKLKS